MADTTLLYGPYHRPPLRRGQVVVCEYRRDVVTVGRLTSAPIPWPVVARGGPPMLIVCGDLVAAIRQESETAIMHHWGVSCQTVWRWKRALGVPRLTEGGKRLRRECLPRGIHSPAAKAKSRIASHSPELMAKRSADRKGKRLTPRAYTAKARAKARASWLKRSRENRRAQSRGLRKAIREGRFTPTPPARPWTDRELALLGTTLDRVVATMVGRSRAAVASKRAKLGLPMSAHARRKVETHTAARNAQIRREHSEGSRTADLARRHNLSLRRIQQILTGR